jgi:hypothetical protein
MDDGFTQFHHSSLKLKSIVTEISANQDHNIGYEGGSVIMLAFKFERVLQTRIIEKTDSGKWYS